MNPSRSQRYVTALLGAIFLFLGYNLGFVLDQAAGLNLDRALLVAFQQCYCLEAALPLAANVLRANAWTLSGGLGGLLLGLATGWAVGYLRRGRPASGGRRFSSFRQASELARFSQALSHTLELERILELLHAEVMHVTGADCGSSFLLDPASPEHRVARRAGEGAELTRLTPMEAEAVSTGRGRLVRDFEAEGEAPPHVGIRSALLAPIIHEEHAIGLIHLHSQAPDTFDSEAHDFVQVLAAQAAVAINNAQRYEEQSRRSEALRQRVNQLQQLSEIPNTVRADRPLTANLESIAQTMQQAGGFGFALIYVFAPEANHLRLAAAAGLAPEWFERLRQQPAPWERLQPFLREEFRSERVFVTPQAQLADVYQALELSAPRKAHEPRTPSQWHPDDLLLVPLHGAGGDTAGLLAVNAPRDPQAPRGPVLEMLAVSASQATLAIENARLLREAEERVNESQARAVQLGALTEATGVIAATLRVEDVITRGLDQLRRIIPYDAVTFWQRDLNDGRWQVAGARSYQEAIERVIERAERSQPRLFSEIVATRGVISVGDVSRDVRFSAREVSTMRSWLGVPVQTGGQVTGILALEKGEDGFYGAAQTPVALAFAGRLGAALENARLHEESVRRAHEMERRLAEQAALNRLGAALDAAQSWPAAAAALVEPAQAALGVDTLYLALCNEAEDEVGFPLLLEGGQLREAASRPAAGVIGHILQTRRPLLLAGNPAGAPSAARAFAGAPLLHGGRVLGVLAAEDLGRIDGLGEAQTNWLQAAAHLLAATAARLEAAAEAARTAAQLAEARAQFAQASQAAQGFEQEAQARARELAELEARHARAVAAARELDQALNEREQARQAWQARASAALAAPIPPAPDDLHAALEQELRQASQALTADAGALFLWDAAASRLESRAAVGEAPAEQMVSLARAVVAVRAAEAFPDLARSQPLPDDTAEVPPEPGAPTPTEAAPDAGPGPFVSGLALPIFALDGEAPAGALVFLSRRPAAFAVDAPAAALAAEQAGLRLRAAALSEALSAQTQRFRALLDDPALEAAPTPVVHLEAPPPASVTPVAAPAWETRVPLPAEPPPPLDRPEAERPARPAWRRAAVPAAIGLMVVCGLAAVTVGPLRGMAAGLLGGAATATPTASATAPGASPATPTTQPTAQPSATPSLEPTDTLAPATPTPTASVTPTSAPTETSTPSISPTPPLPPDVTAVAVVNLPEGIAGRLRDAPNGNVVGGVPGDTLVYVLAGRETTPDNIVWVRIRLPATGQTGWFAEDLLIYQTP